MRTSAFLVAVLLAGCEGRPPARLPKAAAYPPEREVPAKPPAPPPSQPTAPEQAPSEPPRVPLVYRDRDVAAAVRDAEANRPAAVVRRLSRELARIEQEAPLDERLVAYVLLGRAADALRQKRRSHEAYDLARRAWQAADPASLRDGADTRRLGRALEAVGEALYVGAEEQRAFAEALKPPTASARASDDVVRRYLAAHVAPWVSEKRRRIEEASRAYQKIIDLRPVPPPRWVVAAAASVGRMHLSFAEDFRRVTVPRSIRENPELLRAYRDGLDHAVAPARQRAIAAFRTCRDLARRYQVDDERSQDCEKELGALEARPEQLPP